MTTPTLDRRSFLSVAGLAAAALATSNSFGAARAAESERRCKVLIIGAGIGGCIAAYRFAAAGIGNVVLERGRRWPITGAHDTFPDLYRPDGRSAWLGGKVWLPGLSALPGLAPSVDAAPRSGDPLFTGCAEYVASDHIDVICGAGVGGGTLTYAGMLPQPRGHVFERVFPSALDFQRVPVRKHVARVGGDDHRRAQTLGEGFQLGTSIGAGYLGSGDDHRGAVN